MKATHKRALYIYLFILVIILISCSSQNLSYSIAENLLSGQVVDAEGPVAMATVRIQGTSTYALTDLKGGFSLPAFDDVGEITVSAWTDG